MANLSAFSDAVVKSFESIQVEAANELRLLLDLDEDDDVPNLVTARLDDTMAAKSVWMAAVATFQIRGEKYVICSDADYIASPGDEILTPYELLTRLGHTYETVLSDVYKG